MTLRRWLSKEEAIEYARGYRDDADILISPMGATWHVIHPDGTKLWESHGYRLVAQVRVQMSVYLMLGDELVPESCIPEQ